MNQLSATVRDSGQRSRGRLAAKREVGGKILMAFLAVFAIGGAAFGAYSFWMQSTGPELAHYLPADTQVYVEVPSVTKAMVAAIGMDWIELTGQDTEQRTDVVEAFEQVFDVQEDEAEAFLTSISSVAFGCRRVSQEGKEGRERVVQWEGALLVRFSDREAVETVLGSKRFKGHRAFTGGTQYTLALVPPKKTDQDEERRGLEEVLEQLGEGERGTDEDAEEKEGTKGKKVIVWFRSEKLVVVGDQAMVEDIGRVISGDETNLGRQNAKFAKATWPSGSSALAYADADALPSEIRNALFDGVGPLTGSIRFGDAGIMVSTHIEMAGNRVPKRELLPEPVPLSLYEKLPASTVAYLAFSTKFGVNGTEMGQLVKASYIDLDESGGERIEKMHNMMKDQLGFGLESLFDAMGDEAIVALTADDSLAGLAVDRDRAALEHGSVIAIVALDQVEGTERAEKTIEKLKSLIDERSNGAFDFKQDGHGFIASPGLRARMMMGVDASFSIAVEQGKYLVVIVGSEKSIEEANEALDGKGTLRDDKAHRKALAAFEGAPLAVMWLDAGRVGRTALRESKDLALALRQRDVSTESLVLEGADRVTAGYAVRASFKDDGLAVDIDTLNLPVIGALSAVPLQLAQTLR